MRFYNIISQGQAEARSLAGWFGGKEGLKYFIFYPLDPFKLAPEKYTAPHTQFQTLSINPDILP